MSASKPVGPAASFVRSRPAMLAVVGAVAGVLFFYGLGGPAVHCVDEAWHAQPVLEMYRSGDLWHPTAFGMSFFIKPAPLLWLMVGASHVLGFGPLALRLWPALFGWLAVIFTSLLGERIGGRRVGLVAGLALATSYLFVYRHCARSITFDTLVILSFVLSTWLFLRAVETGRGWVWVAAAAALASHGKNFAGAIPVTVFVLFLLVGRPQHRPRFRDLLAAGAVFAAVNLAWIGPMALLHGQRFLRLFIRQELVNRPTVTGAYPLSSVLVEYWRTTLAGFFPWSFAAVAGVLDEVRRWWWRRDPGSLLVLLWIAVYGAIMCLVLRRALSWYPAPLLPFASIAAARLLVGEDPRPRWARWARVGALVASAAAAAALWLPPVEQPFKLWSETRLRLRPAEGWWMPAMAAGFAVAWLAAWLVGRRRGWRPERALALATTCVLAAGALLCVVRPLAHVGYENVYLRACRVLEEVRGDRPAALVVNRSRGAFDHISRFYFSNLEGFRTTYELRDRIKALQRARGVRGRAFCVLVSRGGAQRPGPGYPGRVIFRGNDPGGPQLNDLWVTVVEVERGASRRRVRPTRPGSAAAPPAPGPGS